MKIAFIVNNYPPRTGGVELHVQALAQELLRLGHDPHIVTLERVAQVDERDGVPVVALREHMRVADILGFPGLGARRQLTKRLRERGIDVVSVHTRFFPMSYVGYRAALRAGVPVVHTEHGSGHVVSDSKIIAWASKLVDWTVGRIVLRGATLVLGVSEEVCGFVKRLSGVDAQLFYNAIHLDESDQETVELLPSRWVFVGRLVPGKGWEVFLDLILKAKTRGRLIDGHIIGNGVDRAEVIRRVNALGLEKEVTVHGRLEQQEVRNVLRGATLVNPTTLSEGFQTTLLEALAEGGRILTFPVPGAKQLQAEGAPVAIAASSDSESLFEAFQNMEEEDPPQFSPILMGRWGWANRGRQYASILRGIAGPSRSKYT